MKAHNDQAIETSAVYWLNPAKNPPPIGKKIFLLTGGKIAVVGQWSDDCLGWHPLFKIPEDLKK